MFCGASEAYNSPLACLCGSGAVLAGEREEEKEEKKKEKIMHLNGSGAELLTRKWHSFRCV